MIAVMSSRYSSRKPKFGIETSTPYADSSGKPIPASRINISSPYRTAIQFIPNSPIPPSGMISRTLATDYCYSDQGELSLTTRDKGKINRESIAHAETRVGDHLSIG